MWLKMQQVYDMVRKMGFEPTRELTTGVWDQRVCQFRHLRKSYYSLLNLRAFVNYFGGARVIFIRLIVVRDLSVFSHGAGVFR